MKTNSLRLSSKLECPHCRDKSEILLGRDDLVSAYKNLGTFREDHCDECGKLYEYKTGIKITTTTRKLQA